MKQLAQIRDWIFNNIHSKNLVYNTCWEDPRCDRSLLDLNEESSVVMITSAGCNALDYLLDEPEKIHCIDMNPRQNALLNLKLAFFKEADHKQLFQFFGKSNHQQAKSIYHRLLRNQLDESAQKYWDKNIKAFNGKGLRKSFYYFGTSGTLAWASGRYFRLRSRLYKKLEALFDAISLEEQRLLYTQIEPQVLTSSFRWFVNRHFTMYLAGVPRTQRDLFVQEYPQGVMGYIKECFQQVFTELEVSDNYFYQVYFNGEYTPECCPSYLKEKYFAPISNQVDKITTHTSTISDFLQENPSKYSHYVLLDHQDWLASHNIEALEEEWRLILKNSRPGTKILLRSAAKNVDFFPEFVLQNVVFEKEKTAIQHQLDRVGTYGSVYLGIVK